MVQIAVFWRFFDSLERHAPIKLKFGVEEYTIGSPIHAKFGHDWRRAVGTEAQNFQELIKFAFRGVFLRAARLCYTPSVGCI